MSQLAGLPQHSPFPFVVLKLVAQMVARKSRAASTAAAALDSDSDADEDNGFTLSDFVLIDAR